MKNIFRLNTFCADGLKLEAEWNGNICDLTLSNVSDKDALVGDITLFSADMPYSPDTEFYAEGYNMLSQYGGTVDNCKLIGSFSDYDHYRMKKPEGINQVYNMILFFPRESEPLLVGFCSCFRFSGWIRFNTERLEIAINGEDILLEAGKSIRLEQVYIGQGERNTVLADFADAIAVNHPRLEFTKIPTGWCSWLVYGPDITEKNIYDNLDAIADNGLDLEYIQIDDGYLAYWGDWFDFTDKFEGGVRRVCLDIKEKGFEPAIWVAPFVAEGSSRVFREHPDWFIKDDSGMPLPSDRVTFGGWRCAPWYILDTTNPEAIKYIKTVFSTMRNEWQIRYFKLDAIVWEALPFGVRYDRSKTSVEAFRLGMDAIYEATGGDSFILGGNSPMWPAIGKVHGMRVTNDNQRGFYQFSQIGKECFNRNWQHNRFWINDPDTVLLQNSVNEVVGPDGRITSVVGDVTDDEFAFNAAYTMASGGMVLSGDDVSRLSPKNIALLKRLLPPTEHAALFDDTTFTVGRAKINDEKTVIYVFNFDDFSKEISIKIDKKYEVYDLINDRIMGVFEDEIRLSDVRAHIGIVLVCKAV